MASLKRRIALFGGTFDPPHVGHLIIAEQASAQLKLDRIIFIPAFLPPHKRKRSSVKPEDRLRMTRLAVRNNSSFEVSDVEIRRGGVSYTVDTVNEYRERFPSAELFIIIGSDNLAEFTSWKSYRQILQQVRLIVYPRPGRTVRQPRSLGNASIHVLKGDFLGVSSSAVRAAVRAKKTIRYIVPDAVKSYIELKGLYGR